jgi:hypothetical protein
MPLSTVKKTVSYTITDVTINTYPINFNFLSENGNINVYLRDSESLIIRRLKYGSDYVIQQSSSGDRDIYGNVVLKTVTLKRGDVLTIERDVPLDQTKIFDNQTIFSSTMEYAIDKLTALLQDLQFQNWSIRVPIDESVQEDTLLLPSASERNGYLGFDQYGRITILQSSGTGDINRTLHIPVGEAIIDLSMPKNLRAGNCPYFSSFESGATLQWFNLTPLIGITQRLNNMQGEIDTAVNDSSAAVATANTAMVTASTALSTGTTALETANTAISNAAEASTKADTAISNAAAASSKADTAISNAAEASSKADTAISNAAAASFKADTAISDASAASSKADAASEAAFQASSKAGSAYDLAYAVSQTPPNITSDDKTIKITPSTTPTPHTDLSIVPATKNTLGGVIVGNNLSIDEKGVLSASGGGSANIVSDNEAITANQDVSGTWHLKAIPASSTTLGVVKSGAGINVNTDGSIFINPGAGLQINKTLSLGDPQNIWNSDPGFSLNIVSVKYYPNGIIAITGTWKSVVVAVQSVANVEIVKQCAFETTQGMLVSSATHDTDSIKKIVFFGGWLRYQDYVLMYAARYDDGSSSVTDITKFTTTTSVPGVPDNTQINSISTTIYRNNSGDGKDYLLVAAAGAPAKNLLVLRTYDISRQPLSFTLYTEPSGTYNVNACCCWGNSIWDDGGYDNRQDLYYSDGNQLFVYPNAAFDLCRNGTLQSWSSIKLPYNAPNAITSLDWDPIKNKIIGSGNGYYFTVDTDYTVHPYQYDGLSKIYVERNQNVVYGRLQTESEIVHTENIDDEEFKLLQLNNLTYDRFCDLGDYVYGTASQISNNRIYGYEYLKQGDIELVPGTTQKIGGIRSGISTYISPDGNFNIIDGQTINEVDVVAGDGIKVTPSYQYSWITSGMYLGDDIQINDARYNKSGRIYITSTGVWLTNLQLGTFQITNDTSYNIVSRFSDSNGNWAIGRNYAYDRVVYFLNQDGALIRQGAPQVAPQQITSISFLDNSFVLIGCGNGVAGILTSDWHTANYSTVEAFNAWNVVLMFECGTGDDAYLAAVLTDNTSYMVMSTYPGQTDPNIGDWTKIVETTINKITVGFFDYHSGKLIFGFENGTVMFGDSSSGFQPIDPGVREIKDILYEYGYLIIGSTGYAYGDELDNLQIISGQDYVYERCTIKNNSINLIKNNGWFDIYNVKKTYRISLS